MLLLQRMLCRREYMPFDQKKKSNFRVCLLSESYQVDSSDLPVFSKLNYVFKNKWLLDICMFLVKFCSCSPKLSALRYPKNEPPHNVQLFMGIMRGTYTTLAISRVPVSLTGKLGMCHYSFIYTTCPCQCN